MGCSHPLPLRARFCSLRLNRKDFGGQLLKQGCLGSLSVVLGNEYSSLHGILPFVIAMIFAMRLVNIVKPFGPLNSVF